VTTIYWYKIEDLERPPPTWSVAGRAEKRFGVNDREKSLAGVTKTGYEWAGAAARRGIETEIDPLTCTKDLKHYRAPVWSADLEVIRERAVAEERVEIAHSLMQKGKYDEALEILTDALEYYPNRALIHGKRGMPRTVLDCQVSKMVNSDTCPRPTTGACYVFLNELQQALAEFQIACDLEPEQGAYWRGAGMANYHMGYLISAEEMLKRAVDGGYEPARRDYDEVAGILAGREADLEARILAAGEEAVRKEEAEAVAAEQAADVEQAEAEAAEIDAAREEDEAQQAEADAVKEWEEVEAAKLQVAHAELELLEARKDKFNNMDGFLEAQQHVAAAKAKVKAETDEATAAQASAQHERDEAIAARRFAIKEKREAEEAREIAERERKEAEQAKLKLVRLGGADLRGPLQEGDKIRLTVEYTSSEMNQQQDGSTRGCLNLGEIGEIVLLSSDGERARVMGANGQMHWYHLHEDKKTGRAVEIERAPHDAVEGPELPCDLDPYYLAHMKKHDDANNSAYYDHLGARNGGYRKDGRTVGVPSEEAKEESTARRAEMEVAARPVERTLDVGFSSRLVGSSMLTPNPQTFDVRDRVEKNISVERDLLEEQGCSVIEMRKREDKEKELWQKRIALAGKQRKIEREERGGLYNTSHQAESVMSVLTSSRTRQSAAHRDASARQHADRKLVALADQETAVYGPGLPGAVKRP
jgi:tetratricopeptide (TPR) repeat protein